jgi:hypothetical protein
MTTVLLGVAVRVLRPLLQPGFGQYALGRSCTQHSHECNLVALYAMHRIHTQQSYPHVYAASMVWLQVYAMLMAAYT